MDKRGESKWLFKSRVRRILLSFSTPKTPTQVEQELGIKKLKLKPFLNKNLLQPLTPDAKKGRFYVLSDKAKRLLALSHPLTYTDNNWQLISWIMASPKQRLVVLQAMNSARRTSETIRKRASRSNPHLTRISTKTILKELIAKGLVDTQLIGPKRYYWINDRGKLLIKELTFTIVNNPREIVFLCLCIVFYLWMQFWWLLVSKLIS